MNTYTLLTSSHATSAATTPTVRPARRPTSTAAPAALDVPAPSGALVTPDSTALRASAASVAIWALGTSWTLFSQS